MCGVGWLCVCVRGDDFFMVMLEDFFAIFFLRFFASVVFSLMNDAFRMMCNIVEGTHAIKIPPDNTLASKRKNSKQKKNRLTILFMFFFRPALLAAKTSLLEQLSALFPLALKLHQFPHPETRRIRKRATKFAKIITKKYDFFLH